ncbi:MAG: hypothetical protein AAF999_14695 [Pseudomonadota bacterium]
MQMIVRDADCIVFEVNAETLEPISKSYIDPFCHIKPKPSVWYMSFSEWFSVMDMTRPPLTSSAQARGNADPLNA